MQFLNPNSDVQWQSYKALELIPDVIQNSPTTGSRFTFGLGWAWALLLTLLADELVEEQTVEYLDRCWSHDESEEPSPSKTLQRLWALMN
ncbi:hypothetical protein [Myxacorys almedinensis]|uniref:Uncharacterized protein n=1 Tax=Myxacorys almedinensis A TaxID=2690445 RepID=A0A8J7Z8C7_9CYAN|nr:hypothetical protein [Myxacorys almedinensis]NDJ17340.1 hypothetical protein [Myxacorys almedinensis A]